MLTASSIKQRLSEPDNVKLVIALLDSDRAVSRHRLAKEICRRLDLRDGKGDSQIATTCQALRELRDQGLWTLPEPRSSAPRGWNATRLNQPVAAPEEVPASAQAAQPQVSYAQATGGHRHDLKAYYRFLNNERSELNLESMLQSHRRRTVRRMKNERTALIVQDTTDLNLSTRSHCEGLGQIGTNPTGAKSRGLRLHSSLALSQEGLPLGLVQLQGYAPQSAEGKDRQRPIEQKESYRWIEGFAEAMEIAALIPNTRVISVADREADLFELFDFRRRQTGRKAELLIRAKTDRCLEATEHKLFEELAAAPLARTVSIAVPRQREHLSKPSTPGRPALPAREAQVEIRFKQVALSAPNTAPTRNLHPITLWAIYLLEKKDGLTKLSLGVAILLIAQLGGYLNRKCDRVPGFETLWKGYARFSDMVEIIKLDRVAKSKKR